MESMDVDGLFGLGALAEDAKDIALLGVGAGGAVLIGEAAFQKIGFLRNLSPTMKAVAAAALGIGGGVVVGRYVNKGLGAGVGAGLFGWAVAEMVRPMLGGQVAGLGATDESLLLGLGYSNTDVEDYRAIPGQTAGLGESDEDMAGLGEYEDESMAGLGDGVNVNVSDEAQVPGGGYLSGLGSFIS